MTVVDDTLKGTTLGDPDGPMRFVETLGVEVPTFIDPRLDLVANRPGLKRLDYHVPYKMRDHFRPEDWPEEFRMKIAGGYDLTPEGYVKCIAKIDRVRRDGEEQVRRNANVECKMRAVNRTLFCQHHGGALHPADRKLSIKNRASITQDVARIDKLNRVQKFMQGFVNVEELTDEEISKGIIINDDTVRVPVRALGVKFEQEITKELHRRLNNYLKEKTGRALEVLVDLMDSDLVEPADRIKAAGMIIDRTMGKTPDVVLTQQSSQPAYASIMESITAGSRDEYRKNVKSTRILDSGSGIHSDDGSDSTVEGYENLDPENEDYSEELDDGVVDAEVLCDESESPDRVRIQDGIDDGDSNGLLESGDSDRSTLERIEKKVSEREEATAARERLKKAKRRRFAARAVGLVKSDRLPYVLEYQIITNVKDKNFGKFKLAIHHPEDVTEQLMERVRRSNDPTRQREALVAAAARAGIPLVL